MNAPDRLTADQAAFLRMPGLASIFDLLEAAGAETRVNGGAVRNALLGEPVKDVDLSTTLTPDRVMRTLTAGGIRVIDTGAAHGTVTAVAEGCGFEITTLREDVETHGRHATVRFGTSWEHDVRRRDFTMNALYCDREGKLFDPLGGYGDLMARRVRFIGDARQRIAEDRLRILRFFRFFAWYGHGRPDQDGLKACAAMKEGLRDLSAERVWMELRRLLGAPDPVRVLLWMRTAGVLDVVLPESSKWGIDLIPRLAAAEGELDLEPDAMVRLMAIVPPKQETVASLATRLKLSNAETQRLAAWAAAKLPRAAPPELARDLYAADRQAVLDRLVLERARVEGDPKADAERARLEEAIRFTSRWEKPAFPLSGKDLLSRGMTPGPELGARLGELERRWVQSDFSLTAAELLAE